LALADLATLEELGGEIDALGRRQSSNASRMSAPRPTLVEPEPHGERGKSLPYRGVWLSAPSGHHGLSAEDGDLRPRTRSGNGRAGLAASKRRDGASRNQARAAL
jgi:hypothetical protein